jgi:hypothetical protein
MGRRDEDLKMLDALLENEHELSEHETEAFTGMRRDLHTNDGGPRFYELTDAQRAWAARAHERVVSTTLNLVSRGLVPRGREVAPAPVLKHLPTTPPPLPKPTATAPRRNSRRHCGNEESGCYASING